MGTIPRPLSLASSTLSRPSWLFPAPWLFLAPCMWPVEQFMISCPLHIPGVGLDQPCHLQFRIRHLWSNDSLPNHKGKGWRARRGFVFPQRKADDRQNYLFPETLTWASRIAQKKQSNFLPLILIFHIWCSIRGGLFVITEHFYLESYYGDPV